MGINVNVCKYCTMGGLQRLSYLKTVYFWHVQSSKSCVSLVNTHITSCTLFKDKVVYTEELSESLK